MTTHETTIDSESRPRGAAMGRFTPLVTYLPFGLALIAASHGYLWARLVRDVGFPSTIAHAFTTLLGVLGTSIPVGVVASRFVSTRWSRWWLTPVYAWIGTAFFLVLAALATDALRGAYVLAVGIPWHATTSAARMNAGVVSALGLVAAAWAVREARTVRVERVEIPLRKLAPEMDGLRIVQLSDLHIGPTLGGRFLAEVVTRVNALRPDAVVITGDLVDGRVDDLAAHIAPLGNLVSAHGTFFVTGNHEYHAGAAEWCEHLGTLGVRVLRNEHVALEREGHLVHLAGIDDYESAHFDIGHGADLAKAVRGRDRDRPLILLAHQPRAIHEAVLHDVDLQLSGHTHGGQLWPSSWLVRTRSSFASGLGRLHDTVVYVSRGTGHSGPPMRLGAPPEITEIVLRAA